jgi:hypothetical protein
MSLGLNLIAKSSVPLPSLEIFAHELAHWLRETYSHLFPKVRIGEVDESRVVFCQLHPSTEEFELVLIDSTSLVTSANTTTVGPGYHIFLTALLKDCATKFGLTWQEDAESNNGYGDDTGFFFSGDEPRLREEMTWWLKALARTFFDGTFGPEDTDIALCMPLNPQFNAGQAAITPMGPRTRDWLLKTAEDGKHGSDFFAWWDSGLGAGYHLGRALAHMWSNVRWRKPMSESEKDVLADVANSLSSAYRLDPTLQYPWSEWLEILDLLETGEEERTWLIQRAIEPGQIGYRRGSVRTSLNGGWTIKVPGAFSDFDSDEDGAISAIDPPREIWFTAYQSQGKPSTALWIERKREIRAGKPEFLLELDSRIATATVSEKLSEAGKPYFILHSSVVCPGKRCVCTILFHEGGDKDWALETWKSIQPPSDEPN